MKVIKDKRVVEDDWRIVSAEELEQGLPPGDVLLPADFWLKRREELASRAGQAAVYLQPADEVEPLQPYLDDLPLIALSFPQFKDGRAYSQARLLRDRYGYRGEIRAVGDVLRDQLYFMRRCGIDSFQVREDKDAAAALEGLDDFSLSYQAAADGVLPLYRSCR